MNNSTETLSVSQKETEQTAELSISIPSAQKALERLGSINPSVIFVQLEVGRQLGNAYGVDASEFYIDEAWWDQNIDNSGSFGGMAEAFDTAYKTFVEERLEVITDTKITVQLQTEELEPQTDDELEQTATGAPEPHQLDKQYEIVEQLVVALNEAEDDAMKFAHLVEFDGKVEGEIDGFLQDLLEHVVEKYRLQLTDEQVAAIIDSLKQEMLVQTPGRGNTKEMEDDRTDLSLSTPESRRYTPDEDYRFLVHVPLGNIDQRADEIGTERDGVLMTSLVSKKHQGTFTGAGCLLIDQPTAGSIKGISSIDVGAEIPGGRMDSPESIVQPAPNWDYNQIDIAFDGTKAVGVMIRLTPDGRELGNADRNADLRRFARERGLPIVELEVSPSELPTEPSVDVENLPDDMGSMLTIGLPHSDTEFYQLQVRRNGADKEAYHTPGTDRYARATRINQYGESDQALTEDEKSQILEAAKEIVRQEQLAEIARVTADDVAALERDMRSLQVRG